MGRIVVAGGGLCGLAAAMVLADDGHEVVVLERDAAAVPASPARAFDEWDRRSVVQFGLAHWLQPRGSLILRTQLPAVHRLLEENGGFRFNLVEYILGFQPGAQAQPDDDRFETVTGRRSTMEWAMASAAERHPGVTVRRGVTIAGLATGAPVAGVPHVNGVRLAGGEVVGADLVIDATGRRSSTSSWLEEIGARPPVEDAEDIGFAYYGRYFHSDDAVPALIGPLLTEIGSFSVLTLPADNNTWSVTLFALSSDAPLRRFRDPEVFERVVRACPLQAHWLAGQPISEMASMVGVLDRHRRFVVDGKPSATGVLSIADARSCTNPSLGRGITFGLMHVELLREAIRNDFGDPVNLAVRFEQRSNEVLGPWHEGTVAMDRARSAEMNAAINGQPLEVAPDAQLAGVLQAAMITDATAARAFVELVGCFSTPEEVFSRPGFVEHLTELSKSVKVEPAPGPSRSDLLELVSG